MTLANFNSPQTDRFIGALCNTLVHSLWQGLILAAITGLIIVLTRWQSPARRYNLLIAALALFAVGVGLTFAMQFEPANALPGMATIVGDSTAQAGSIQINIAMPTKNVAETLFDYLNQHHNIIVMIWFMIICAKSIQLVVGLMGVRRLKHTKVHQVTQDWQERMQHLANSLAISQPVVLLESALAKVPMVIGALKPVILIPIGLLTALSTQEVEAILVHELAHIKRRDYLVNLLQSLMEIVFFFNPAVLWTSQLIKAERENCCDDLAMAQSGSKVNYIRALVSCQEYQAAVPAYAVAFAGDKNTLMNRVKRMVNNRNHSLNLFEKTVLAVCLVVSGVYLTAFTPIVNKVYIADTVSNVIQNIQHHTETGHTDSVTRQSTIQKEYGEQLGQVIGKAMADSKMGPKLSAIINKNMADAHLGENIARIIKRDMAAARPGEDVSDKIAKDIAALHLNEKINDKVAKDIANTRLNEHVADQVNNAIAASGVNERFADAQNALMNKNSNADSNKMNINLNAMNVRLSQMKVDPKVKLDSMKMHMAPLHINLDKMNIFPKTNADTSRKAKIKVERKFDLANALYDAHLIQDKNNYKVEINNKQMVINGVKQPESVHQTYLKYYMKSPNDNVNVNIVTKTN